MSRCNSALGVGQPGNDHQEAGGVQKEPDQLPALACLSLNGALSLSLLRVPLSGKQPIQREVAVIQRETACTIQQHIQSSTRETARCQLHLLPAQSDSMIAQA